MIPLQSTGGDSTILIELFLFLITCCSTYIAWRARKIWTRFDKLTGQVDTNSMLLMGDEETPYNGIVPKVEDHEKRLQRHKRVLKRLKRALEREDAISGETLVDDLGFDTDTMRDGGSGYPDGVDPREGD